VNRTDVDGLIAEAEAQPFTGWDFSWLDDRLTETPTHWDYTALVAERARVSPDLLDMGTGGGEWLSSLPDRPPLCVATEGWPPNVSVAAARLRPLGAYVVQDEGAVDNSQQASTDPRGRLPFKIGGFHLVVNRHEAFNPAEVARILAPGGWFVTQQVGEERWHDVHRLLGLPQPAVVDPWRLSMAVRQVQAAGLLITRGAETVLIQSFADVAALVWYLRAIPWEVPGFTAQAHRDRLVELQAQIDRDGPLEVRQPRFWLEARKPG
jgi:SAM-dependent methyltransferase